jgi:C4-type Zn-finger protein
MSADNTKDNEPGITETTYRITITKVVKNFPFRNKEYQKVGVDQDEEGEDKTRYGYVYFDDTKDVETQVYRQEIDSIELPEIIKAVNRMDN